MAGNAFEREPLGSGVQSTTRQACCSDEVPEAKTRRET